MESSVDEFRVKYPQFNPLDEFVVLFNLYLEGSSRPVALLSMVWRAPELPKNGDIIHAGGGKWDLPNDLFDSSVKAAPGSFSMVLRVKRGEKSWLGRRLFPEELSWSNGDAVTIDAELLHVKSVGEFFENFRGLLHHFPRFRTEYKASLHIHAAADLAAQKP